jgi:hypothetical protein
MIDFETERQIKNLIQEALGEIKIRGSNIGFDEVKAIHIGDGVRMIRAGLAANRPTSGEKAGACYFATDSFVLSVWTGSVWKDTTLA